MKAADNQGLMEAIVDLEAACFGETAWTTQQVAGSLDGEGVVAVAVGPHAYALGRLVLDEVELYRIGVRPTERRRGLGARTLAAFEALAIDLGATVMHLEVRADNAPAIGLYTQRGMIRSGRRAGYYPDGCDALWMSMRLSASRG